MPSFQIIEDLYGSGLWGTDAFGTSAFGGPDYPPWELPFLHTPSDDPAGDGRREYGEIEHRRLGLLVGSRKWKSSRRWRIVMEAVKQDTLDSLEAFAEARRFRLLQDDDETGRVVLVKWRGGFEPQPLRGGYYTIDFEIEEVH